MINEITIAETPDEAEDCKYVVCKPLTVPLVFADNKIGACCKCGQAIQHRPHIPTAPETICWDCARPIMTADAAKGELEMMITPKTAVEVAEHLAKKRMN